jgi:uncharacterized protein YcnI
MLIRRTLARLVAPSAAGLLVVAVAATPAAAHVTISPSDTAAGAYTVLTFSVGHGCEGSPTTALDIQIPEEILSVTPTLLPGWEVEKKMVQLDEPVEDAHGNSVTERVGRVVYTADQPLAEGYRAAMEVSLQLPDTPGETLTFPVIQRCVQGETGWTETPAEGQDPEVLERPAPTVTITEATGGEHGAATVTAAEAEDDEEGNALGVVGLGVGAVALAVGGVALARTRRRT